MSTRFTDIAGSILIPGIIPTGNLLWVDAVNGNDSLAVRGRLSVPFKTLTAAKNAAVSGTASIPGDTIMVLPGKYNEKNLLKNYVNWYFFPGALVEYAGSENGGMFDTSANGTNAAVNSVIAGYGEFKRIGSGNGRHIVYSSANDSSLRIEAIRMYTGNDPAIRIGCSTGSLSVNVLESIIADNDVISVENASTDNFVQTYLLNSSYGNALSVTNGSIHLKAHRIQSNTDIAVSVNTSTNGGNIVIEAYEIVGLQEKAVYYSGGNAILAIYGARIWGLGDGASGRAIEINSAASHKIRLFGCTLIAAGDVSIYAANASTWVHCYSGLGQNIAAHANVSYLGVSTTNSNIT